MQALLIYDSEDSDAGETSVPSSTDVSVADSWQESPESPCKEGTADVYPDNVRDVNTAATVNKADYFGLEETSSEESDTDQPKPKAKKAEHSYVQEQNKINMGGLEIELPDTHFWSKTSIDLQDQPIDNISQNANRDTPIISNLRNSYAHQRVHKYCADRKRKSTKDQSQSTTVGQSTESLAKRLIYHIHSKISPHLHGRSATREYRVPSAVSMALVGHSRVVNRVKWCCPNYSHLLLSASLDGSVKVWNCWSQLEPCVRTLTCHSKAVKDAEWDANGRNILSCSYDRTAALTDVDTGKQRRRFSCPGYVTCGKFHPVERDLVIVGSNNQVLCWDVRTAGEPVKTFSHKDRFGQVEDVIVTRDGGTVFGTGDLISRDSSDRNIMAWDFSSSVLLSNQIFQEKYACTRLKLHPTEPTFLAQTHGNYIAMFSTKRPYKLNKYCRFDGHKLMGYSIGFDMSPDGKLVCSGSGEGKLHFYNYHTGKHWRTLDTGWGVALDVAYHPVLYSTVACSGWNGRISVWS